MVNFTLCIFYHSKKQVIKNIPVLFGKVLASQWSEWYRRSCVTVSSLDSGPWPASEPFPLPPPRQPPAKAGPVRRGLEKLPRLRQGGTKFITCLETWVQKSHSYKNQNSKPLAQEGGEPRLTPCVSRACNWSRSTDTPRGGQIRSSGKSGLYSGGRWFSKCVSTTGFRNITREPSRNTNSWGLPRPTESGTIDWGSVFCLNKASRWLLTVFIGV